MPFVSLTFRVVNLPYYLVFFLRSQPRRPQLGRYRSRVREPVVGTNMRMKWYGSHKLQY